MLRIEGEEINTNQDVNQLLKQIRSDPRTSSPRVLIINQVAQMRAKNDGYPVDMYHATLLPVSVRNEEEETAIAQHGYQRQYIARLYPKYMFRRNMHPRFQKSAAELARIQILTPEAKVIEMATLNEHDYIEERIAKDAGEEKKLLAEKPKTNITGSWVDAIGKIEPFPDAPEEDPAVTIANLRGQIEAMAEKPRKSA